MSAESGTYCRSTRDSRRRLESKERGMKIFFLRSKGGRRKWFCNILIKYSYSKPLATSYKPIMVTGKARAEV